MKQLVNTVYSKDFQEARVLDLFLPDDANKKGIVIFIHGGNWQNGNKSQWQEVAEYFCQNGFLTATINYRLAPKWNFPAQIEDVRLAVAFVKKQAATLGFSPQKLTLCGINAGAYLALLAAVIQPNEYLGKTNELLDEKTHPKAVIAFSPIVSLIKDFHSAKINKLVKELLDFDPSKEQETFIKDSSPSERPEDFNCPLLIIHPEKNKEIPLASIRKFQEELLSCQVPVKLFTGFDFIDSTSPIKVNPELMRLMENFLQEFLI